MSDQIDGHTSISQYRSHLFRFGLPYVVVTALVFSGSLLATESVNWLTYLLGWAIALASLAISFVRPQFWMLAPFGALAGALLVRSATDGLDSGLGPLLMIPAIAVAIYGSRQALFAMIGSITVIVILIEILANEDPALSPVWRQDAILVVLATVLAIAIQDLMTRLRSERALADARGRQIEQLNEITKAIATSTHGGRTLCEIITEVTDAAGAALFDLHADGTLNLVASEGGRKELLRQIASGPALAPLKVIETGERKTVSEPDHEINLQRMAWQEVSITSVLWVPTTLNDKPVGVLALAYKAEGDGDAEGVIAVDLLAAEGTIAIQQHRVTEQLETLASTDPLTEVDNRRGWERIIERALARAGRNQQPLCLALLDLDHFKQFNDARGHQAGDSLLSECARAWQRQLRIDDHIARFGGDEFVLTLPGTDINQALDVVERLRAVVPEDVTCSAGVAVWTSGESVEELVERADEALYLAKENGRNVAMAAGSPDPV